MKFAEKCPKCSGFVQTKSVRKSIGLGFVEIPVAQFCLNPVCDWYQDFAEARRPEEIKEGYHLKAPFIEGKMPRLNMPVLSRNHTIILGSFLAIIIIYFLISFFMPVSNHADEKIPQAQRSEFGNSTTTNITPEITTGIRLQETPQITAAIPTPDIIGIKIEPMSHKIKMDVGHGFIPENLTINISDTIMWYSVENMRPRVVLVSRDGLFANQPLKDYDRYQYQFNKSGKYTFALAENGTYKEYPNATGSVIVR